jgi:hypothetical protein
VADDRQTFSRAGTARAIVLLGAGLSVGGAALLCLLMIVLIDRFVLAAAIFLGFALVSATVAVLVTVRARSVRSIVGFGCGTLLIGLVIGLAVMLLLISSAAGNPA